MNTADHEREAIETTAAEWLARRDRVFTAEEAVAFARWRLADPRHAAAVAELERVWGALDGLWVGKGEQRAGDVAAASPAPLAPAARTAETRPGRRASWRWPALALAAALVVALGAALWRSPASSAPGTVRHETAIGARQKVTLPDGSVVHLNTDTAVMVQFDAHLRRVVLERGEALFAVRKDAARPFLVAAARAEARAVGTQFLVRLRDRESEVLVTEGRVRFGANDAAAAELRAGDRAMLALADEYAPRVETLDAAAIDRRLAWQAGRIEFKNTPLREAVAEFNRYHPQRIELRAEVVTEPVGGSFEIGNREGFLRSLETMIEVVVVSRERDKIVLGLRR